MFNAAPAEPAADDLVGLSTAETSAADILLLKPVRPSQDNRRDQECRSESAFLRYVRDRTALAPVLSEHGLVLLECIPLVEGSRFVIGVSSQGTLYQPAKLQARVDAVMEQLRNAISFVRSRDAKAVSLPAEVKKLLAHMATTRQQLTAPGRAESICALDPYDLQYMAGDAPREVSLEGVVREICPRRQRVVIDAGRVIESVRTDGVKIGDRIKVQCRHVGRETLEVFVPTEPDRKTQAPLKLDQ